MHSRQHAVLSGYVFLLPSRNLSGDRFLWFPLAGAKFHYQYVGAISVPCGQTVLSIVFFSATTLEAFAFSRSFIDFNDLADLSCFNESIKYDWDISGTYILFVWRLWLRKNRSIITSFFTISSFSLRGKNCLSLTTIILDVKRTPLA